MNLDVMLSGLVGIAYLLPLTLGFCTISLLSRSLPFWLPPCGTISAFVAYWGAEHIGLNPLLALSLSLLAGPSAVAIVYFGIVRNTIKKNKPYQALLQGLAVAVIIEAFLGLVSRGYARSFKKMNAWPSEISTSLSAVDITILTISGLALASVPILRMSKCGQTLMAIAGNRELAEDFGLPVQKVEIYTLIYAALLCSVSAICYAVRFDLTPRMFTDPTMKVIAVVVAVQPHRAAWACLALLVFGCVESYASYFPRLSPLAASIAYITLIIAVVSRSKAIKWEANG